MIGNSRVASVKAGVWEVADGRLLCGACVGMPAGVVDTGGIVDVDATGGSIDVGVVTLG